MTERDVKFIRSSIIEILSREYIQKYGKIDAVQIGIIENTAQLIINNITEKRIAFALELVEESI